MAIQSRGEFWEIAGNHGKFRSKNNGDHFEGKILAVFGVCFF